MNIYCEKCKAVTYHIKYRAVIGNLYAECRGAERVFFGLCTFGMSELSSDPAGKCSVCGNRRYL